ncbi:hypothetical protein ABW16_11710 [Mycolicibacter heraklionensis]|uniref:Mce protein n=1 Tax=Mycolicibacter heraklionensis TaxID=512402 RepID=A0ABR5FFH8_9MYCO|nr:hypothetical protein [Mycolicibacter heraklionensis]KLO28860.1 hypothetical protein ABW16_11710 [Mycolicibacter heraklionensis]
MTTDLDSTSADALAQVEAAEAEAEAAEALAVAAKLRAKAIRLRNQLEASSAADVTTAEASSAAAVAPVPRNPLPRRLRARSVATGAACLLLAGLMAACGFMGWRCYSAHQLRERASQFAAAASQGVVDMTTLDFNAADDGIARVLANSTGEFRDDFIKHADDFKSVVRDSKVTTAGTVNTAAVESMTKDAAVVLVAATSTVTNAAGGKEQPRNWRLSVTVTKDGDQFKMSKVEFVP